MCDRGGGQNGKKNSVTYSMDGPSLMSNEIRLQKVMVFRVDTAIFPLHLLCFIVIVIVIVISKLLKRYSKAKRMRAPAYSRALRRIKGGFPKGVKRGSGPNSRVPGGDRVAVRVGVVEMGRGNAILDPSGQFSCRSQIS